MRVKDLIEILKQYDGEMEIMIDLYDDPDKNPDFKIRNINGEDRLYIY